MITITQAMPIEEAVAKFAGKTNVPSTLRTADWEKIPVALRERSYFSAGVDWSEFLDSSRSKLNKALGLEREQLANGRTAYVDRSSFIGDMRRQVLDARESDGTGGLTDLASRARLGLIYDMQTQQAFGFARWKNDQLESVLDAFPAQELIRVESRLNKRDWQSKWEASGGELSEGGRMVALKDDPIWVAISRFGVPWPPFEFGSGMGLRDISRREAIRLGIMDSGDTVQPTETDFNAGLEASLRGVSPDAQENLVNLFGDMIEIVGDAVKWVGAA